MTSTNVSKIVIFCSWSPNLISNTQNIRTNLFGNPFSKRFKHPSFSKIETQNNQRFMLIWMAIFIILLRATQPTSFYNFQLFILGDLLIPVPASPCFRVPMSGSPSPAAYYAAAQSCLEGWCRVRSLPQLAPGAACHSPSPRRQRTPEMWKSRPSWVLPMRHQHLWLDLPHTWALGTSCIMTWVWMGWGWSQWTCWPRRRIRQNKLLKFCS